MFKKDPEKPTLQKTIDSLLEEMASVNADSDEYAKMAEQLERVYKLKEVDSKKLINVDMLIAVLVNYLAVKRITNFERENVVTSKALGFIRTLKP